MAVRGSLAKTVRFATSALVCAGLTWPIVVLAAFDREVAFGAVVIVSAYENERLQGRGHAVLIAPGGVLIAPHFLLEDRDRVTVTNPQTGAEVTARIEASDASSGLVLISAPGFDQQPLSLALDPATAGARVFALGRWGDDAGAVQTAESAGSIGVPGIETEKRPGVSYISHNAMIPALGYGAPLLNECGQIVAINLPDPSESTRRQRRGLEPSAQVFAVDLTSIRGLLQEHGTEAQTATEPCLSDVEVALSEAEAATAASEEAKAEAEEANAAAEQAKLESEEAGKQAEEAEKRAAELQRQAAAADEESEEMARLRQEAEQLAQQARTEAEELQRRAEQTAAEAAAAAARSEELQRQLQLDREKAKQRMMQIGGAALGALLLLLILWFWRSRVSGKALARASQLAESAAREADEARLAASKPPPRLPDALLEGMGSDGQRVTVKIPGADLAQRSDGLVIGRHPAHAQVVVDDPEVSRQHARLTASSGQVHIEDLGSTNGTRINGQALTPGQPTRVSSGDSISLGRVNVRYLQV